MMMEKLKIHSCFKLNDCSFKDIDELLAFVKLHNIDGKEFLDSWFDEESCIIVTTSGSTGTPKAIKIKKEHMLNSAKATGSYFGLFEKTTALLCMSSKFIAGKMMWVRALSLGWELDVVEVNSKPLGSIEKSYEFAAMVPIQVSNSLGKMNNIRTLIIGGGSVSKELQEQIELLNTKVFATYGMTETVTHIAVKKLNYLLGEEQRYYHTLPSVIISKDERGCLVVDAPLLSNKKIVTNDLVDLISENSFEWLGRFDSVINSGGVKLIPELIESKISKIVSCNFFLIGVKDSYLGEKLALVIEADGTSIFEKSEIKNFLKKARLGPFEIPKEIHFVSEFEMTETGKIRREPSFAKVARKH